MPKEIISFGFKIGQPSLEEGDVCIDIRNLLRNPYKDPRLRKLTGLHERVKNDVEMTENFPQVYEMIKTQVCAPGVNRAFIGCMGGRHRSVYIAQRLSEELGVPVLHRELVLAKKEQ
jgi:RNase adapter protein RapZ